LPDGNYTVTLPAPAVIDTAGNVMSGNYSFGLFSLAGDANHDRVVNAKDLGILSMNWQGSGKTFAQGDFNYDGIVDIKDLYILASRWQKALAPPPPPAVPVSLGVRAPVRTATRLVGLIA
jgi:hypothetical protein